MGYLIILSGAPFVIGSDLWFGGAHLFFHKRNKAGIEIFLVDHHPFAGLGPGFGFSNLVHPHSLVAKFGQVNIEVALDESFEGGLAL